MIPADAIPGCRIGRLIAEGGCGEIYSGQDLQTNQPIALKILHPRHYGNKQEVRRLLKEGSLGMRLRNHENLVRTIRMGDVGGAPFVILEFVPGRSLREILRERRLSDHEVLRLAIALSKALQYMHEQGIYHKDIKPDNIMMDETNNAIKLLDLGFSETRLNATLTFFNRTLEGSPAYMAPELLLERRASPATDIYALGCTLYEAATGSVPFPGNSDRDVVLQQTDIKLRPTSITELNPEVSFLTQRIILTALEKKITFRYRTADEIWMELARHPSIRFGQVSL